MDRQSVLIITEVFSPEEFLINDIARKWISEGKKVSVLTRNPAYPFGKIYSGYHNKLYSKNVEKGITVYRYHIIEHYKDSKFRKIFNYIWNTILATSFALMLLRKNKNIFIYHTGPLTVALPGVLLKKINKGRVVIWTQDVWPDIAFAYGLKKNKFTVWLINKFVSFIYKNCDQVITTSRPIQMDIQRIISSLPVFIPNWPSDVFQKIATEQPCPRPDKITFTFAGNIGVMQNLDNVLMAFHQWANNREDIELNIYGDGSALKDLQEIIKKNNIQNVNLKGRVPVETMLKIYNQSDVLLISLRKDEVLEKYVPAKFSTYLVAGKPIFGILSGAVKDYIENSKLGYVSNPQNINEIMEGFEYFTTLSFQEKNNIKQRAKALYKEEFDSELNLGKLSSIVFQ